MLTRFVAQLLSTDAEVGTDSLSISKVKPAPWEVSVFKGLLSFMVNVLHGASDRLGTRSSGVIAGYTNRVPVMLGCYSSSSVDGKFPG